MQLATESRGLLQLGESYHQHDWDVARDVLTKAKVVGTAKLYSGFGEGSTIACSKRPFSVIASPKHPAATELLVVSSQAFLRILSTAGGDIASINFEAVNFLRESGIVGHLNFSEVIKIAGEMKRVNFRCVCVLSIELI
jgi:hypothetical protein